MYIRLCVCVTPLTFTCFVPYVLAPATGDDLAATCRGQAKFRCSGFRPCGGWIKEPG